MLCPRGVTKTIVLKSPDSDKVREVIVTSVLLPKSENENNRTLIQSENSCDLDFVMERRACKRRLDHLTLEEKIMRKKLKNREAAQTSRDRKKARLEELETSVVQLQNENESLHEEVQSLKDERDTLLRENARLTEEAECWRTGPRRIRSVPPSAAGSVPAPPPSPHPPPAASPVTGTATGVAAGCSTSVLDDNWDWLDEVPLSTPVVEELEQLANSLFAEARKTQEPKPSQESVVGPKTESLEPCWSLFLNPDCNLSLDTSMDKVTYLTDPPVENKKTSPKFPKLDINLAQNFCEKTLETPEVEETVVSSKASKASESEELLETAVDSIKTRFIDSIEERPTHVDTEADAMEVDGADSLLSDGMDCVVNEEVVETTEFVESEISVPEITLTGAANSIDLSSDDEGMFCPNLLKPKDILEESSSDHGYESYDSPISEPEELVNLFPELW